jgi:putative ABC transport system permease protein
MRALVPVTGRLFGLIGRMAPRNLVNALSRTAVAVAALDGGGGGDHRRGA